MNLISYGATHHAQNMQEMMPETFTTLNQPAQDHNTNYIFGLWNMEYLQLQNGLSEGKTMYLHMVGTDAIGLLQTHHERRRYIQEHPEIKVAAQSHLTQNILRQCSIPSEIVTLGPNTVPKITPYPETPTYAFYYGRDNGPYDIKAFLYYALHYPRYKFKIYGNKQKVQDLPPNTEVLGWLNREEMTTLISQCSGLLRLNAWDGFSQSLIEFAMAGRHIVSNMNYPKLSPPQLGMHTQKPQFKTAEWYTAHYSPTQTKLAINKFLK